MPHPCWGRILAVLALLFCLKHSAAAGVSRVAAAAAGGIDVGIATPRIAHLLGRGRLQLRGGKEERRGSDSDAELAGGGEDEEKGHKVEVSDPAVDSLDAEIDALDLDGPRPERDWSEYGTEPHPPAYKDYFDEEGGFDMEGYMAHSKWPGRGVRVKGDDWRFVSTRMEAWDAGAEYGIFVDIEATNRSLVVTGVKCASHALSNPLLAYRRKEAESYMQDPLDGLSEAFGLSTWVSVEGSSRGKEANRSAWRLLAHNESVMLPRINGKEDWDAEYREKWVGETPLEGEWFQGDPAEPSYGSIPWENVTIQAGERRGFLIHGNLETGIANRWPLHCVPKLGDVSDQDKNIRLYSSRAMGEEEAFTEEIRELPYQQCEEGLREGLAEPVEADYVRRRREGHSFVGEILYTLL